MPPGGARELARVLPLQFRHPMNVLVTGGAGYIGSVMTETLLAAGHRAVVYDNLSHGYRDAVPPEATSPIRLRSSAS